jgi:hypothetical protein
MPEQGEEVHCSFKGSPSESSREIQWGDWPGTRAAGGALDLENDREISLPFAGVTRRVAGVARKPKIAKPVATAPIPAHTVFPLVRPRLPGQQDECSDRSHDSSGRGNRKAKSGPLPESRLRVALKPLEAPSAFANDELSAFFIRDPRQRPVAIQCFAFVCGCLSQTRNFHFRRKA